MLPPQPVSPATLLKTVIHVIKNGHHDPFLLISSHDSGFVTNAVKNEIDVTA
jgi:hypothetical protein